MKCGLHVNLAPDIIRPTAVSTSTSTSSSSARPAASPPISKRVRVKEPVKQMGVVRREALSSSAAVDTLNVVRRIHRRCISSAPHERLAVSEHRRATEGLETLHAFVLRGVTLCEHSQLALTCCGVALVRRIFSEVESRDTTTHLRTTLTLLFAILLIGTVEEDDNEREGQASALDMEMETETTEDDDEKAKANLVLKRWREQSLSDVMYRTSETLLSDSLERAAFPDSFTPSNLSGLTTVEVCTPGEVCQALLLVAKHRGSATTLEDMTAFAIDFFRGSAMAMSVSLLDECSSSSGNDFLTLSSAAFLANANNGRDARLQGLVDGAESETGQAIFRDMILSFTLPRHVVGVRRTCLLTRESNATATKEHPELLNAAHEAALRGAAYVWENDSNELYRLSAILSGIAMLLLRGGQNELRRADAFEGLLNVPFLETKTPPPGTRRLVLLEATNEWVVFEVDSKHSQPVVALRAGGFEGLCRAALLFVESLPKTKLK